MELEGIWPRAAPDREDESADTNLFTDLDAPVAVAVAVAHVFTSGRAERIAESRNKFKELASKRATPSSDLAAAAAAANSDIAFDTSISPPPTSKSPDSATSSGPPKLVVDKAREAEIVHRLSDSAVKKHKDHLRQIQVCGRPAAASAEAERQRVPASAGSLFRVTCVDAGLRCAGAA